MMSAIKDRQSSWDSIKRQERRVTELVDFVAGGGITSERVMKGFIFEIRKLDGPRKSMVIAGIRDRISPQAADEIYRRLGGWW